MSINKKRETLKNENICIKSNLPWWTIFLYLFITAGKMKTLRQISHVLVGSLLAFSIHDSFFQFLILFVPPEVSSLSSSFSYWPSIWFSIRFWEFCLLFLRVLGLISGLVVWSFFLFLPRFDPEYFEEIFSEIWQ